MATFISSFTSDEIEINYKEPYLTGALNEKQAGLIPAGTYRGFNLTTHASALTVTVAEDTNTNDHLAQYETADGYSIRIRRTTGDFGIDLSAVASTTVVIAIYADYTLSQTTEAEIRAYELSPTDDFNVAPEKDELVVLGTVEVPASGVISDIAITPTNRTPAWGAIAIEAREPVQVVKNGDFRIADSSAYVSGESRWPWWDQDVTQTSGNIEITEADGPAVGDKHLHFEVPSLGSPNLAVRYNGVFAVVPGSKVRVAFQIKGVSVPAGATHMGLEITVYGDGYGDTDAVWYVEDLTLSGTWAYTEIEQTINLSSNARYIGFIVYYRDISISTGDIYFDDIRMWLEQPPGFEGTVQGLADMTQGATITNTLDIPKVNAYGGDIDYFISTILSLYHASSDTWNLRRRPAGSDAFLLKLVNGDLEVENQVTLGSNKIATDALAELPRITSEFRDGANSFTLLWELQNLNASKGNVRIYACGYSLLGNEALLVTINAAWDSSTDTWNRDVTNEAHRVEVSSVGLAHYYYSSSDSDGWSDTGWQTPGIRTFTSDGGVFDIRTDAQLRQQTTLGSLLTGDATDRAKARLECSVSGASGSYTHLWKLDSSSIDDIGLYAVYDPTPGPVSSKTHFCIVHNAVYSGTQWSRLDSVVPSTRYDFTPDGINVYHRAFTDTSPWNDSEWDLSSGRGHLEFGLGGSNTAPYSSVKLEDGVIRMTGITATTRTDPAWDGIVDANALYSKNIVKAWAAIEITGAAGSRTVTCLDGFGLDAVSIDTTGSGFLSVDLDEPMEDHYVVVATPYWRNISSQIFSWTVWDNYYNASGICELYARDGSTVGWDLIDLDAISYNVEVCLIFIGQHYNP